MSGSQIDLSAISHPTRSNESSIVLDNSSGSAWVMNARFSRVMPGVGRTLSDVVLRAENDGRTISTASLTGHTGRSDMFDFRITPGQGGRTLSGSATDIGGLLRALDLFDGVQGGQLTLSGRFDHATDHHTISGTARVGPFRLVHAPVVAKLMQSMTLYGLVNALRGPGLGFNQLIVPFHYREDILTLRDAQVFNASLGLTAKGELDLAHNTCDLQGTFVPARFFNGLPGKIPLIGNLISPERGGGLLAATYFIRGPCDDAEVGVKPLASVTPALLRGLFGTFDLSARSGVTRDKQSPGPR